MTTDPTKNKKRQRLFKWIAAGLPILFFVLLEILLRIVHYGNNTALFIDVRDKPGFAYLCLENLQHSDFPISTVVLFRVCSNTDCKKHFPKNKLR